MTRHIPMTTQISWAEAQARQHARIANRAPVDSAARRRAEAQRLIAEAAVDTLRVRARVFPDPVFPQQETA